MAGFFDNAIAQLAWWDLADHNRETAENDRMLQERAKRTLERTDLTPLQEQQAQKNLALVTGNRVDPAEGSGKIFVDEAVKQGGQIVETVAGGVTNLAFGKLLPFTLVAVGLLALLVYFRFAPVKS